MKTIEQTLVAFLSEIVGERVDTDGPSGNVLRDYGLDSLQSVTFVSRLEKEFGVVFGVEPEDMAALVSMDKLAAWVAARRLPAA